MLVKDAAIKAAVAAGKVITIGDCKTVIDARGGDNEFVMRIPVPKSPHGVNISPDGKYAMVSGKLSPTVSVVDISKIADAFAGKIQPRDCVIAEPEVGVIYTGKVVKVVDFGAFVNFLGNRDGLVHISELAEGRTGKVTDVANEGDEVKVKVLGIDDRGKARLSMKAVNQKTGEDLTAEPSESPAAE